MERQEQLVEDARLDWCMGEKFMGRGESWKKNEDDGRVNEEAGRRGS